MVMKLFGRFAVLTVLAGAVALLWSPGAGAAGSDSCADVCNARLKHCIQTTHNTPRCLVLWDDCVSACPGN
jgi:hypothetical protein